MTAPAQNKIKSVATAFALAGLAVAASGLIYLFVTPKTYRATARIQVEKRNWTNEKPPEGAEDPYDPHLAPAECEVLQSNVFLDRVIQNLDLKQQWSRQSGRGAALSADQARERLRMEADVHPMPDASVIVIDVTSGTQDETARIANEFARLYLDYNHAQRSDTIRAGTESLGYQWDLQNQKVQKAEAKLEQLQLAARRNRGSNGPVFYDSDNYARLQAKRTEMKNQADQLREELNEIKSAPSSQRRQFLASLDTDTNSVFNLTLAQMRNANKDLADAQNTHGPDSPEVKRAQAVANQAERQADQSFNAVMMIKEADLASRDAALAAMDEEMKTDVKAPNEQDPVLLQNQEFAQASSDYQRARQDRELLHARMEQIQATEIMPIVVTAQLIDRAETPKRPFTPDNRSAAGIIGGGGLLLFAGLALYVLGRLPKSTSRRR